MLLKEVKEWLTEYKGLNPNELHTFAHNNSENEDLLQALHKLFDSPPFYVQELDPVCHQLFEFYRSPERKLQLFALEFVPSLVWLYLRCLSLLERKVCGGVETFLLGVYNLEIVQADGSPIVETFRIPTLSTASIYHEHSRMPGVSEQLTEHALRQLNLSHTSWRSGPFPQFESINAQNRFSILALVMQRYNKDLDAFHSHALISACRVSHKLSQTGFSLDSDLEPRIALSPALLVELLISVYYAMFNGHHKAALKAVESVHKRASYELFSDVLLMTNALLNSHRRGNFKLERDDSIAKSTKIAHPRGTSITNASFKAKKLPDDIEFVEGDDVHKLATVDELETEQSVTKALKAKLMNIGGKLGGDRNKNRDSLTPRHDGDSPRGDPMDSVDVAVVKAGGFGSSRRGSGGSSVSGSSKIIVDMLEMQPVRTRGLRNQNGGDFEENGNDSGEAEYCESSDGGSSDKTTATTKIASSSLIFSKKHGISKVSGQAPGSQASSRITSSPSAPGQSSFSSPNLNTSSVNGKPHGDGPDFSSPRAQSEGPVGKDAKPRAPPSLSSMSTPPSSSSSSFPNSSSQAIHSSSSLASEPPHANSSVPHTAAAPSSSTSTHSMPEELNASSSKREKRYSGKGRVNRNSYSTDL